MKPRRESTLGDLREGISEEVGLARYGVTKVETKGATKVKTRGVTKGVRAEVIKVVTAGVTTGNSITWGPHPERLV